MGGFAQLHAGTGAVLREEAAAIGTMRFLTASDEGFVATVSGCTTPGSTAVLDPTTWSTRFQLPPPPTSGPGGAVQAHPAQGGGRYFDDGGTTVRAFDLDGCGQPTCQPDWEVAVPGDAGAWQIAVSSDGSSVYAGTTTVPALVVRLDAATGDELGRMVLAGPQLGTFAIADGVLFAATEHDLEAFDAGCTGTCAPLWSSGIPGVRTPMAVGAGVVHVRTGTTTVESFDASGCGAPTCTPIGTTEVSHDGLLVANGRLLTTDGDGTTAYAPG
jgi:outer membrane protein assembly factor BamB